MDVLGEQVFRKCGCRTGSGTAIAILVCYVEFLPRQSLTASTVLIAIGALIACSWIASMVARAILARTQRLIIATPAEFRIWPAK